MKVFIYLEINQQENKSTGTKKGRFSGGVSVYFRNKYKDKISIIEKNEYGLIWIKINWKSHM